MSVISEKREKLDKALGLSKDQRKRKKKILGEEEKEEKTFEERANDQILNYQARLEAAGLEEPDDRNDLEKILNLDKNQGLLGDIAEVIDRPANAIRGAITEAQEGDGFLEGLKRGIAGDEDYYYGEVIRNALDSTGLSALDPTLGKNPLNKDELKLSDIVGTGADIFLDPLNVAAGAGIAGKVGKGAKLAKGVSATQDTLQGLRKLETAVKSGDEVGDLTKIASDIQKAEAEYETAQKTYDAYKKAAGNTTVLEGLVKGAAYGTKKAAQGADKLITKGLSKMDQRAVDKLIKKGASQKEINQLTSYSDLYSGVKKGVSRTVDYSKSAPNDLANKVRSNQDTVESVALYELKQNKQVQKAIKEYTGRTPNFKSEDDVNNAIQDYYDSKLYNLGDGTADTTATKALRRYVYDGDVVTGTKESITALSDKLNSMPQFSKLGLTTYVKSENGIDSLAFKSNNKNLKGTLRKTINTPSITKLLDDITVTRKANLDDMDLSDYKRIQALYNSDADFRKIVDSARSIYEKDKLTPEIAQSRKDYSRKALNADVPESLQHTYDSAKYGDQGVREANRNIRQRASEKAEKIGKDIEKKQKTVKKDTVKNVDVYNPETGKMETKQTTERIESIRNGIKEKEMEKTTKKEILDNLEEIEKTMPNVEKLKNMKLGARNNKEKQAINAKIRETQAKQVQQEIDNIIDTYNEMMSPKVMQQITKVFGSDVAKNYTDAMAKYNKVVNDYIESVSKVADATTENALFKANEAKDKAYLNMLKMEDKLAINKTKLEASITDKQVKNIKKTVKDINKLTNKRRDKQEIIQKSSDVFVAIKQATEAQIAKLDKAIEKSTQEIERLNPLDPANKTKLKKNLADIEDLQALKTEQEALANVDYFSSSYTLGLEDYIRNSSNIMKKIYGYNEVIMKAGLYDESIMRFTPKGAREGQIPAGMVRLDGKTMGNIKNFLNTYKNLLPESSRDLLFDLNRKFNGSSSAYIDKTCAELLNIGTKELKESTNSFLRISNGLNNFFKKNSTLSPGFLFRAITGNSSNMVLSGMKANAISGELKNAQRIYRNMGSILEKGLDDTKVLTASEKADFELAKDFINAGFLGQGSRVRDLQNVLRKTSDLKKYHGNIRKMYDGIFELNMKANEGIDGISRLMVLSYARKHPEYVAKLNVNNPIEAVKHVIFDPSNMSPFEQNVMKKIIPFYTFTKQNLLFQAKNVLNNTSKYSNLLKAVDKTYSSLDEDQYRDYQMENMQIPIYTDENGNVTTLKTNLPAADLFKWINNPTKELVGSMTPYIKTPFEQVTGVDTFTGQALDRTPLETVLGLGGMSNMARVPERLSTISEDNTASQNFTKLFGSVASYNDSDKIAMSNLYEDLQNYQTYIQSLKDQGIPVPTLTELKQQGVDIDAIRDRISGNDSALRKLKKKREELQKSLGY